MFGKLAAGVVAHPWRVIGAWAVGIVVVLALSPQLVHFTSNNNSSFLPASYGSVQAQAVAAKYFPAQSQASGALVVSSTDHHALTPAQRVKVRQLVTSLKGDHITSVAGVVTNPEYLSSNKKVQLVEVTFSGQAGAAGPNAAVPLLRQKATDFLSGTGLQAQLTGSEAISVDSTTAFDKAEKIIAIATVVLILVLLGAVFRSLIIALLPIVVIGIIHQVAQALTADLADWFHFVVGPELAPLLVVVMFGVGTDYIVFLVFRYRERMAGSTDDPKESLRFAVERVGEVVASAAGTVIAAFAALLVASLESLKTLAPGLIVGVLLMLAAALTLVPAIFSLLGRHLFWPVRPKLPDPAKRSRAGFIARQVATRPGVVFGVWVILLAGLTLGMLGYRTTYDQLAELPSSTLSQQAFDTMSSAFPPGYLGPTQVYVVSSHGALTTSAVTHLKGELSHTKGVSTVVAPSYSQDGDQALIQVLLSQNPYSVTALDVVAGPIRSVASSGVSGASVYVGGTTAQLVDVRSALHADMLHVFPLALGIVAVILAVLLSALAAPLYLLLGVVLAYAATLGSITLIFLRGFGWVGLDFTLPIIVYLFVMAIGTDYNILMSSRLREEFRAGKSPRQAASTAILHGVPAVSAAALILAGTFASLLLTGIQLLQEIGLAVALGVLLAANVLATRIVPTLAAMPRWHFWWPHRYHAIVKAAAAEEPGWVPGGAPADVPGRRGAEK